MAISRISAASAQAATVAITTPTVGDLILVFAHRDGNATAPSLVAGYTNIDAPAGLNTNSARLAYKYSDGTEANIGTWTNATSVAVGVYRGIDPHYPIGMWAIGTGASVTLSYAGITLWATDNTSWVAGFAGHRTATNVNTAPTNMTLASGVADCALSDTNATTTTWSTQTVTVNANSGWVTYAVEIRTKPAVDTAPSPDYLVQHVCGANVGGGQLPTTITATLPNLSLAGNCIVVSVAHWNSLTATVADDKSNTYTLAVTGNDATNGYQVKMFVALNCTAGVKVITVTVNDSGVGAEAIQVAEFSNIATSSAVDVSAGTVATVPAPIATGSITTTQANDLIYQVAFNTGQFMSGGLQPQLKRIVGGAGLTLLSSDLLDGVMAQYGIKAVAGAINPTMNANNTGAPNSDIYVTAAVALKTAVAGTAPASGATRIIRVQACNYMRASASPINLQFPCTGDLQVVTWVGINTITAAGIDLSAVTDGASNLWVATGAVATTIQGAGWSRIYYTAQPTSYPNRIGPVLTLSASQEQSNGLMYDCSGFGASPFEQDVVSDGNQNGTGNLTTVTVTPLNRDGLIIASGGIDLHTISGLVGATFFFDDMVYPSADGSRNFYEDNPAGHVFNTDTSAKTFTWTVQNNTAGVSDWVVRAAVFRAPIDPGSLGQIAPNQNWRVLRERLWVDK